MNIRYLSCCIDRNYMNAKDIKERLDKFAIKSSSQLAKEPNAINVRLDQNFEKQIEPIMYEITPPKGMLGITISNFLQNIIPNHSDIKNEQTVEVIKKAMEGRRE